MADSGRDRVMDRRYRLSDNRQFQRVKREGRSWSHYLVVLCVLPNGLDRSRFGFSVSKRVGKAVVRNRVKRLLREAARARQARVTPGQDLVFVARGPMGEADHRDVDQAVELLLTEAGLLLAS
jgi:ribonuclease P protein component